MDNYQKAEELRREHEMLRGARNLIDRPECWTTMESAVDDEHNAVSVDDENAYAFCATGAIECSAKRHLPESLGNIALDNHHREMMWKRIGRAYLRLAMAVAQNHPGQEYLQTGASQTIVLWNDDSNTDHDDVINVFNAAMESVEAELTQCSKAVSS